jgi:hypothetical protein
MLIGASTVLNKSPGRTLGGSTVSDNRANFGKAGANRNRFYGAAAVYNAVPIGYTPPYCWIIAQKGGGMAATGGRIAGAGAMGSVNLAGGLNGIAPLTGSGSITGAALALIVSAVAALTGTGALTGDIKGLLDGVAALSGAGDLVGAIKALADASSGVSGTGDATATASAKGSMSSAIIVTGDVLSTANVADAILDALNGVEQGMTVREALRLIAAATAGKVSGAAGTTITIRSAVADNHDRIIATVDASGNRTAVVTDLTG